MEEIKKTISVCICTYNQEAYIEKAIQSVVEQTLKPLEIIVSDDCSTDATSTILNRLQAEISFLRVIRQPTNLGIAKNVDSCLRLASGEFIVRLDSDDYLEPSYIEKLSDALYKHTDAGYAHASVREVDEYGHYLRERKLFRSAGFQSDVEALKASLKGYRVAANILMFRKSALERVNFLSGRPNFGEDYHLTAAISDAGFGNVYLSETLAFYRVWTDPKKVRTRRKRGEIEGLRKVFDEVICPAFLSRNWPTQMLIKRRTQLACSHADCLGWDVFENDEKLILADELLKLSPAVSVRLLSWVYLNGYGGMIEYYNETKGNCKQKLKSIVPGWLIRMRYAE